MESNAKKEIFQAQFTEKMMNIFKGGLISAAVVGSTALTYSVMSPYMNNFTDMSGMLNGLGSIINGSNPIFNELLKNSMALSIVSKSMSAAAKQKDFFVMKGQSMIYSLAGKIYDANPEKYQNIEMKKTVTKESTLERLEKLPSLKVDVIRQAQRLLKDYENGQSPVATLTEGIYSLSDANQKISHIISEKLDEQGFELDGKKGKEAISHLLKNPLSIQNDAEKNEYIEFASDHSKLKSIYNQENDTSKFKNFLKSFSTLSKKKQIEDSKTQRIRALMRQKIGEATINGKKIDQEEVIGGVVGSINSGIAQYEARDKVQGVVLETLKEVSELKVDRSQLERASREREMTNDREISQAKPKGKQSSYDEI